MATIINIAEWEKDKFQFPLEMRNAKRWLLHKNKIPYYVNGKPRSGKLDSEEDLDQLAYFHEVAHEVENYSGLAFALGKDGDGYWQGIDLDSVTQNGLGELAEALPGYVELSPSGKGVHAIGYGEAFSAYSDKHGQECYSKGRFFTVTGNCIRAGELVDLKPFIKKYMNKNLHDAVEHVESGSLGYIVQSEEQLKEIRRALFKIDPDCGREVWINILFALCRTEGGLEMWAEWSATAKLDKNKSTYEERLEKAVRERDTSYRGGVGLGTLFYHAKEAGYEPSFWAKELIKERQEVTEDYLQGLLKEYPYNPQALRAADWAIDNLIIEGIVIFPGGPGAGKTSTIVPLASRLAWLVPKDFLFGAYRRKVIYITEDRDQVERLLYGIYKHQSKIPAKDRAAEFKEWFKVYDAQKYNVRDFKYLAESFKEFITVQPDGKRIAPIVIFDTQSATFNLEEENANEEVSKYVSELKTRFWYEHRMPIWIVAHTAKNMDRSDARSMTARGAGAWGADCHDEIPIFSDEDFKYCAFMSPKKRRGNPRYTEIKSRAEFHTEMAPNYYGDIHEVVYSTAEFEESNPTERKELKQANQVISIQEDVIDCVNQLIEKGLPTTYTMIRDRVKGANKNLRQIMDAMVGEGKLELKTLSPGELSARNWNPKQSQIYVTVGSWSWN